MSTEKFYVTIDQTKQKRSMLVLLQRSKFNHVTNEISSKEGIRSRANKDYEMHKYLFLI